MKKIILTILVCGIVVLGLTGCETKTNVSIEGLNNINNKIIDYFQKNGTEKYNNYSYNYVDEKNKVVIVGLIDNSKKEQKNSFKNKEKENGYEIKGHETRNNRNS